MELEHVSSCSERLAITLTHLTGRLDIRPLRVVTSISVCCSRCGDCRRLARAWPGECFCPASRGRVADGDFTLASANRFAFDTLWG
jgi:hypothetical protein